MLMRYFATGCLICGKDIVYLDQGKTMTCEICKKEYHTVSLCEENHFVCDICHQMDAISYITSQALSATSRNPVEIAKSMMEYAFVNMHGPEHHYLACSALLSAFKNSGGSIDLEASIEVARQRTRNLPGGICGLWGCCGAGVSSGIFVSIITGATPLSIAEWSHSNQMTSNSLLEISKNGGPRCCKRNVYISILSAIDFVNDTFGIEMERSSDIRCTFNANNATCKKEECLFF